MTDHPGVRVLTEIGELGPLRREMLRCTGPDVNPGAAGISWALREQGPMRTSDLAALLRLDVSVVSRQTAELVAAGHVERRSDPVDRRACLLSVTDAGAQVLDGAVGRVLDRFRPQLEAWDDDRLRRLADELRALREHLMPPPGRTPDSSASSSSTSDSSIPDHSHHLRNNA